MTQTTPWQALRIVHPKGVHMDQQLAMTVAARETAALWAAAVGGSRAAARQAHSTGVPAGAVAMRETTAPPAPVAGASDAAAHRRLQLALWQ